MPFKPAEPGIEVLPERPYLATRARADDEATFRAIVDRTLPELFRRVLARGLTPAGGPWFRYVLVDERNLTPGSIPPSTFEMCVPLHEAADGDEVLHAGALPAGRWVVVHHRGPYALLPDVHALIHRWVGDEGLRIDHEVRDDGTAHAGSYEWFRVGPTDHPDPARWETDVGYLLRD
ncbi:MAG: GyrI-like domain-containing protein [Solirubrobacteraceae bacterium]|nr:GyrI-like domain-containing protein [Solirubrobacteraceae bacterium]